MFRIGRGDCGRTVDGWSAARKAIHLAGLSLALIGNGSAMADRATACWRCRGIFDKETRRKPLAFAAARQLWGFSACLVPGGATLTAGWRWDLCRGLWERGGFRCIASVARAAKPRRGNSAVAGRTCPVMCVRHIVVEKRRFRKLAGWPDPARRQFANRNIALD